MAKRGPRITFSEETVAAMRAAYESGASAFRVGALFATSETTVRRMFAENGITLRRARRKATVDG